MRAAKECGSTPRPNPCSQGSGRRRAPLRAIKRVLSILYPHLLRTPAHKEAQITPRRASVESPPAASLKKTARSRGNRLGEGVPWKWCFFDTFPPLGGAWQSSAAEVEKTHYFFASRGWIWRTSRAAARFFLLKPRSLEDSPLPSGALRRGWGYLRATSARPRLSRPQRRPRRENARRLEPKRLFPV